MEFILEKHFERIGAELQVVRVRHQDRRFPSRLSSNPFQLDIVERNGKEIFEIQVNDKDLDLLDLSILEVKPKDRHLVLLARELDQDGKALKKEHFLCGHDERHLFVAQIDNVSTVRQAKDSLKPLQIRQNEVGLKTKKRNRRKNKHFKRQGEWFFLPEPAFEPQNSWLILYKEPIQRGGRKLVKDLQLEAPFLLLHHPMHFIDVKQQDVQRGEKTDARQRRQFELRCRGTGRRRIFGVGWAHNFVAHEKALGQR